MISIRRATKPSVLQNASTPPDLYDHDDVVKALWDMQCRKCCYCEQHIADMGQGQHVEHFRPKSVSEYHPLRNEWKNLLLACPTCNGQKGQYFPLNARNQPILLDPSSPGLDPEKHIAFIVDDSEDDPIGLPFPKTPRGRKTVEAIGLWLSYYVRLRHYHYRKIVRPTYERLLRAKKSKIPTRWQKAKREFEELLSGESPFVSFVRCFARSKRLDKIGIDIPGGSCR